MRFEVRGIEMKHTIENSIYKTADLWLPHASRLKALSIVIANLSDLNLLISFLQKQNQLESLRILNINF